MILIYIYIFFLYIFSYSKFPTFLLHVQKNLLSPSPSFTHRGASLASHPMDSAYHARRRWWSHCLRWGWVGGGCRVVEDTQVKMATTVFFLGKEREKTREKDTLNTARVRVKMNIFQPLLQFTKVIHLFFRAGFHVSCCKSPYLSNESALLRLAA